MKKLIAIAVVFALIAGTAFADTSVGGQVFVAGTLLQGNNIEDSDIGNAAIGNDQYNTAIKVTFSEGPAGGRIRILGKNAGEGDIFDEAFGWWRPIPQLRIQIGSNQDGDFGTAQISGWGFTGENKNNGGNQGAMAEYSGWGEGRNHSRTTGWYGGTGGTPNLQFSIFATDDLTINIWFPWQGNTIAGLAFLKVNAQVKYSIPQIGTATVSFESNTGYLKADPDSWYKTEQTGTPKVFASFYLTAIENMGVDIGLAYKFPLDNTETKVVTNYPFEVGLGFRFGSGDFNFKLRASADFGTSTITDGTELDASKDAKVTTISASILPSYKVGDMTIFFYAGLDVRSVADWEKTAAGSMYRANEASSNIGWFVNPYVFVPAGGLRFKVGFQLWSDGTKADLDNNAANGLEGAKVNWSIPFGFYAYF